MQCCYFDKLWYKTQRACEKYYDIKNQFNLEGKEKISKWPKPLKRAYRRYTRNCRKEDAFKFGVDNTVIALGDYPANYR